MVLRITYASMLHSRRRESEPLNAVVACAESRSGEEPTGRGLLRKNQNLGLVVMV